MNTPENNPHNMPIDSSTQKINISGDTVTLAIANYPEEQRKLVRWAYEFAKENQWDWDEVARQTKVSTTVLYRIWTGKYINPETKAPISLDSVCEKFERCKKLAEQRASINRVGFVETSVWKRINWLCEETLVSQTIGMIFSDSHIGKTTCLNEFQRRNNHGQTLLATVPPASGVQHLLREIASKAHVSSDAAYDKLFPRVCRAMGPDRLLILDEAHMIFETYQRSSVARCLALIRHLHDRTGLPIVLCATDVFKNHMESGDFRQTMKQLKRRNTLTLQLPQEPAWEDVMLFASAYELGEPKEKNLELVQHMVAEDALGRYTRFLAGAARSASKQRKKLSWDHFAAYYDFTNRLKGGL